VRSARRNDLIAGGVVAAFGAAVLLYVRGFPELPGGQPGPALFPGILGGLMVLFGAALIVQATRSAAAGGPPAQDVKPADGERGATTMPPRRAAANLAAVLGAVAAYLVVVGYLGFVLTMAALLTLLMLRLGVRPPLAAGTAAATSVLVYLLFDGFLLVPLPAGPLGF
jgi:putative tricarboxylic transport membrane protein